MEIASLQDIVAPEGVCYGCGSGNPHGLHIKSYWHEDGIHVMAEHLPEAKYTGWPELVYGGLIAMLVDCHSNWTAMACHYRAEGREPGSQPRWTSSEQPLRATTTTAARPAISRAGRRVRRGCSGCTGDLSLASRQRSTPLLAVVTRDLRPRPVQPSAPTTTFRPRDTG